ncbi:MAG: hypothetical protein LBQ79_13435 [Deltaproteobacteria bacterium]|jgi:hypothetical protein|nr:hypothetical protein [Deltaproteobacteria bacterium]
MGARAGAAGADPERAFWERTLAVSRECLELDRSFMGTLGRRSAAGDDPLDPGLWENYVEARRSLVEFTTRSLSLMARDRDSQARMREQKERLETALGEIVRLEEKLAGFLSRNLSVLKETIDDLSRNQAVFTSYARSGSAKPRAEALEARA